MDIDIGLWAAIGFMFAAYAVVGNDALQTLGTFINSNRRLPWWALFLFAATVLIVVFAYGYISSGGDPSYGRLSNVKKYPIFEPQWYHALPPLMLLFLTRLGIPVSTTFMVLAIFATMGGMQSMLTKSLIGYGLAFLTGGVVYAILAPTIERWFLKTADQQHAPFWVLLQWITTGYLWAVWLMQDFANIFIFLPRGVDAAGAPALNPAEASVAVAGIVLLLAYTFWNQGGPVQRILKSKTNVTDIRSATIIDFTYASLLFYFKELNDIPMSTTWVFLGLIAGREFAIATIDNIRSPQATAKIVLSDATKALIGLVISVAMGVGLPVLAEVLATQASSVLG
ncbi:hypothetical protein [Hyphococcus sp. DH-69]|uniref:hypothetical protein n=1 Tax=Hyphococcus formosus TaxID=3143534 RepID=UPI00398B56BC